MSAFVDSLRLRARSARRRIVFPEGDDARTLGKHSHRGRDFRDARDECAGQRRTDERPHVREHAHAADAVDEARHPIDTDRCSSRERRGERRRRVDLAAEYRNVGP